MDSNGGQPGNPETGTSGSSARIKHIGACFVRDGGFCWTPVLWQQAASSLEKNNSNTHLGKAADVMDFLF